MTISNSLRAALSLFTGVVLLTGCGSTAATGTPGALPAITMTTGGGFGPSSETWTISPDGSWTWVRESKLKRLDDLPSPQPGRSGQLTETQRNELAVLATDPFLSYELRAAHEDCSISDGPAERLVVGSVKYLAGWCDEPRPRIQQLRARIVALTTGS